MLLRTVRFSEKRGVAFFLFEGVVNVQSVNDLAQISGVQHNTFLILQLVERTVSSLPHPCISDIERPCCGCARWDDLPQNLITQQSHIFALSPPYFASRFNENQQDSKNTPR